MEPPDNVGILRRIAAASVAGLYVHVPFCARKCGYCDFYSVVAEADAHEAFTARLVDEMRRVGPLVNAPLQTVYVGGGTPTLLPDRPWDRILAALGEAFDLSAAREFTVEANPETVAGPLLQALVSGGVDRISIGAQSFHPRHLRTLDRRHEPQSVGRAVRLARECGVENVSLDLIFGVPGQTVEEWDADLDAALALGPEHLSCYGLTYEPQTPISRLAASGGLTRCDEAVEAAMYEHAIDRLSGAGSEHYEISNFARPGRRCLHNMLYWTNKDWVSLGPGGAGHVQGVRWKNVPDLDAYLDSAGAAPVQDVEELDADASFGEQLMLRLRLIEGAPLSWLAARVDGPRRAIIEQQIEAGLLERTPTHLRLTRRGLLLADAVVAELL